MSNFSYERSVTMIQLHSGSHTHLIITLLSVVGEFPYRSLHLLGSEEVFKKLVRRLSDKQIIRHAETGKTVYAKLLKVSGKGQYKTIRLHSEAVPVLEWLGLREYYVQNFCRCNFPSNVYHIERNHRVAEAMAMFLKVGLEIRPYMLPTLAEELTRKRFSEPTVYPAKIIKASGTTEMSKTAFTRMVAAVFTYDECYAVYNTRSAAMKWSGMGEFKSKQNLIEIARMNGSINDVNSAILFGASGDTAIETLEASNRTGRLEYRFDGTYNHVYFFELNSNGIRHLRLFLLHRWKERLLALLFDERTRSFNNGHFEYDAYVDGAYVLSHFDGDIARLVRFKEAIEHYGYPNEVLCFPHQAKYVKNYLGSHFTIKVIDIETIEKKFGIGKDKNESK